MTKLMPVPERVLARLRGGNPQSKSARQRGSVACRKPGPGTHLALMLKTLGIEETTGCGCQSRVRQMDAWGCDGCREYREEIVGWLTEAAWAAKLSAVKAAALAVANGLPLTIGGLIDEAIRRAEA